jgi:tol-pal system protein YbgF
VEALPRTPSPATTSFTKEAPQTGQAPSPADRAFADALKTFRSGEHGQAVLELMDFVAKYPKHPLAPRAQLWIGEAYFRQRDYRQALVEYRKAVEASPESTAAADAWLKIGKAYAALRERPAAAAAWQRVLRQYPESEAADQARTLLRR